MSNNTNPLPPYYILLAHSSLATITPSNSLTHPSIQYHYADDSPLRIVPQHPDQRVLVLDYDPSGVSAPTVRSISGDVVVTDLRIEEATGVAAATDTTDPKNDRMHIIDTLDRDDQSLESSEFARLPAQAILAQYKRRNAILRRALDYPSPSSRPSAVIPSPMMEP